MLLSVGGVEVVEVMLISAFCRDGMNILKDF